MQQKIDIGTKVKPYFNPLYCYSMSRIKSNNAMSIIIYIVGPLKLEQSHGSFGRASVYVTDSSQFIFDQFRHIEIYQFALVFSLLVLSTCLFCLWRWVK